MIILKRKTISTLLATILLSTVLAGCMSNDATEKDNTDVPKTEQTEVYENMVANNPTDAMTLLKEGNQRFVSNEMANFDLGQSKRSELVEGQDPFAVVVACSDSRVTPEHLYDQGLGDLFVIRVAGNILDDAEIGSIEYAVEHLDSSLVVILGHEECGAVTTAVAKDDDPLGTETTKYIDAFLDNIEPAVAKAKDTDVSDDELIDETTDINVKLTVEQLLEESSIVSEHAEAGDVEVVGAKYLLSNGEIEWFEE